MSPPRTFQSLDLVIQAAQSGASATVLVEGEEEGGDAWLLLQVLRTLAQKITFYGRDGRTSVIRDVESIVPVSPLDQTFAIVDRDFADDREVELCYAPEYRGHLFTWRRFTIENYLLEPSWLVEVIVEFYLHQPGRVPATLQTVEAVEALLLDWCRGLATQAAGSWVVADLKRESMHGGLSVAARRQFDDLTERGSDWVLSELDKAYGGWSAAQPNLFSPEALRSRFDNRLKDVLAKVATLSAAHQVISGKVLFKVLYAELPAGPKPVRQHVRNRLVGMASRRIPEDIRVLVVERILPRWRRARGLA